MDQRMWFTEHIDVMVGRALAMLGRKSLGALCGLLFMKYMLTRLSKWSKSLFRLELRGLVWTDFPPYEDRCALIHILIHFPRGAS
jgi:hypothetical protein